MPFSEEPILDIIRSIGSIGSGVACFQVFSRTWGKLFNGDCPGCRGTGKITCPVCHGRNIVRRRTLTPEAVEKLKLPGFYEPWDSYSECYNCGNMARLDQPVEPEEDNEEFKFERDSDSESEHEEVESLMIADNIKAALGNEQVPIWSEPLAGTVECPTCQGECYEQLGYPDIERLCKIGTAIPWHFWIDRKVAAMVKDPSVKGLDSRGLRKERQEGLYLEYDSRPVTAAEVVADEEMAWNDATYGEDDPIPFEQVRHAVDDEWDSAAPVNAYGKDEYELYHDYLESDFARSAYNPGSGKDRHKKEEDDDDADVPT